MLQVHSSLKQCGLPIFAPSHLADKTKPEYVPADRTWEPFNILTFASFVDNVFILSKDVPGFLKLADGFERELRSTWNQTIKTTSKQFTVPKGVHFGKVNLQDWQYCENLKCLGITIQHNCETNLTWEETEKTAWKIFYRLARNVDYRSLAARHRVRMLNVHVFPFLSFKLSSLPVTDTRLYQVQKLQRKMLLEMLRVPTTPGADKAQRARERNGAASAWLFAFPWHHKLAEQQGSFNEHLGRSAWSDNWAGLCSLWQDRDLHAAWLNTGRLRRFFQGHIAQRWEKSVAMCSMHATDPLLIIQGKSCKYKGYFDLQEHERKLAVKTNIPECCMCCHRHLRAEPLLRVQNGHYTCPIHRCEKGGKWF